jgi:hypothetical protein
VGLTNLDYLQTVCTVFSCHSHTLSFTFEQFSLLKVFLNGLQDEAVRKVRQCPGIMERSALQDLIHFWHLNLTHVGAACLHRKPFFFRLQDLPAANLQKQD